MCGEYLVPVAVAFRIATCINLQASARIGILPAFSVGPSKCHTGMRWRTGETTTKQPTTLSAPLCSEVCTNCCTWYFSAWTMLEQEYFSKRNSSNIPLARLIHFNISRKDDSLKSRKETLILHSFVLSANNVLRRAKHLVYLPQIDAKLTPLL